MRGIDGTCDRRLVGSVVSALIAAEFARAAFGSWVGLIVLAVVYVVGSLRGGGRRS
jgi:hypothetical protein